MHQNKIHCVCLRNAAHLPLALLQPGPQLDLLVLVGGAALLELLPLLQELSKVLLQLLLLLLELIHLQPGHSRYEAERFTGGRALRS